VPYDKILSVVDGVMLDVKASNERAHRELTGASLAPVLEQVAALAKEGKLAEVRTVVMGDASDAFRIVQNVSAVIEAASEGKRIAKIPYKLIRYRPKGVRKQYLKDIKVPKAESLAQLKEHAEQLGFSPVTVI
jgi:pyruvate formate lyase activating enzyme